MKPLLLAATCCAAVTALDWKPDPWRLLVKTTDVALSIDATRIDSTRPDHAVAVWLRFDTSKPAPVPDRTGVFYSQTQVRLAVDCPSERVRNLAMTLFLPDGGRLHMIDVDTTAVVSFESHSFGQGAFTAVCLWLHAPNLYHPFGTQGE